MKLRSVLTVDRVENEILRRLPSGVLRPILEQLQSIRLAPRAILQSPREPVEYVNFVNSGWASLIVSFEDGFQAEVSMIGREGLIGMPVFHGVSTSSTEAVVRAPTEVLRMRSSAFKDLLRWSPELRDELLRYSEASCTQAQQIAGCNGHHGLEKRLARSLLMISDRSNSLDLPISQEVLAAMLSVHRPSLTAVAGQLQRRGLIRHAAGTVKILNRPALEEAACECYRAIRTAGQR